MTQKYIDELQIKCTSSKQKAKELSGGNQQKVCLAKAFALEPKFLFVSEPTRGIDVGAKALVLEALKEFNHVCHDFLRAGGAAADLRPHCHHLRRTGGGHPACGSVL